MKPRVFGPLLTLVLVGSSSSVFAQQPQGMPEVPPPQVRTGPDVRQPENPRPGVGPTPAAGAQVPSAGQQGQAASRGGVPDGDAIQQALQAEVKPGGLTAAQAAKKARLTSTSARGKREALAAAEEKETQAKLGYLPSLTASGRYSRLSEVTLPVFSAGAVAVADPTLVPPQGQTAIVPAGTPLVVSGGFPFPQILNQYEVKGQLQIPLSDYLLRVSRNVAAQKSAVAAAELEEAAARAKADSEARLTYYQWVRARGRVLVSEKVAELARVRARDAETALAARTLQESDVLAARSAAGSAEATLSRAESAAELLAEQLRTLQHDPVGVRYEVGEDITAAPDTAEPQDIETLYKRAVERRPEVRALGENVEALELQAKAVAAGYFPRLDASGNLVYANPNQRIFPLQERFAATWDVNLVLSWQLSEIPGVRSRVRELDAKKAQLETQKVEVLEGLRLEVVQARRAVLDAAITVRAADDASRSARATYERKRLEVSAGRGTEVDAAAAAADYVRALLESVDARIDMRSARVRLAHAVGDDVAPAGS